MAKRRRRTSSKKKSGISPIVSMLFGLAVGLSVAVAIYVKDRRDPPMGAAAGVEGPAGRNPTPASLQSALDDNGEFAAKAAPTDAVGGTTDTVVGPTGPNE